jgi:hypothetical protein
MKGKVKPDITESQRLVSIPCICVYNFYAGCTGHNEGKATLENARRFLALSKRVDLLEVLVICSRSLDFPGLSCGVGTVRNSQSHEVH